VTQYMCTLIVLYDRLSVTSVLMVHAIELTFCFGRNLCMQYPKCLTEIQQ